MKILVLCLYPISNPIHGGQLRVRNIVDSYRAAGHEVEVAGVLPYKDYKYEKGFAPFPNTNALKKIFSNASFNMEDYIIGRLFAEDDWHYKSLASLILNKPDVIQIEHPWLFSFAKRFCLQQKINAKLVYSSHNIEWKLKKDIISSSLGENIAKDCAILIKRTEVNAIKNAHLISCVSVNDETWIKSQTNSRVILAQNGVSDWSTSKSGCEEASLITKSYSYALYCGSAHPPNITGFFDMFGSGFGSLKPDEKLIIAGGAGLAISTDIRIHQSPKLSEKVIVAGYVSQQCLSGLLDNAHCIVLPLTQGGGTNLKTAEALWSGKNIVATSIAMRGFEKFICSPGVQIADNPTDFKRKLRLAMAAPSFELSVNEREKRRSILWQACLKTLVKGINILAKEISG